MYAEVDDKRAMALLGRFPKIANQEANRVYKAIMGDFMRAFTKARLRKGIFNVKRKVRLRKGAGGNPFVPKKARLAGFVSILGGRGSIQGKYVRVKNSNPLILIREAGKPVEASPYRKAHGKNWIVIRGKETTAFGSTKAGKAKRKRWAERSARARLSAVGGAQNMAANYRRPVLRKVRSAGPFPRIRFIPFWKVWRRRNLDAYFLRLSEGVVRRVELLQKKKAA